MFYHDTKLALISLFIFPLAIYPLVGLERDLEKYLKIHKLVLDYLTSKLAESIGSIKTIKSFNNENMKLKRLTKKLIIFLIYIQINKSKFYFTTSDGNTWWPCYCYNNFYRWKSGNHGTNNPGTFFLF